MPLVSTTTQKMVHTQYFLLERLLFLCKGYNVFNGKDPEHVFCYQVDSDYRTDDGPAMVAIACLGNTYAMLTPDYITQKQMVVYEFILREAEPNDEFVLFYGRDYKAVKKCPYSEKHKVKNHAHDAWHEKIGYWTE